MAAAADQLVRTLSIHHTCCKRHQILHSALQSKRAPHAQAGKGIADKVAALLHNWEGKYKHLWEQDKDAYMR